jgi:hypothetical protein
MAIHCGSSFRTILLVFAFYSMCHVIQVVQGRFIWDFSLYCINYCSRVGGQLPPIGVCSCHRFASYRRRTASRAIETATRQDYDNDNYEQPMDNNITKKTYQIKTSS